MALAEDQRAMLQLLLERDQSYSDIGSLLGQSLDETRSRARSALAEIGGSDPDRDVALTDYLLGQADPITRADVARHLQGDPESRALAEKLAAQLRLIAPGAQLPELPASRGERSTKRAAASAKPARAKATSRGGLSREQKRLIGALLALGAVAALVILIATGAFGGDDGDSGPEGNATANGQNGDNQNAGGITQAVLTPTDGGEARGVAVFARTANRPVLQVAIAGLEPTPEGQSHVIWLYGSDQAAFPLSFTRVAENGRVRGISDIPEQVLRALSQGLFSSVDVSVTDVAELREALRAAREGQTPPPYVGDSVMRGPIVGPGFNPAASQGSSPQPDQDAP